ncbi:putative mitochondrial protein [Cucumis melo var. makuwa]|uniref:Mitochondrial protein n=1 Tax=Cucumis melo var. makuwa TaxID=1194695 RepID=A0A5A7UGH3_CUCMM|nr:putative mitochondrial protein [Cucumis melo var. makuwa]TYK15004.1 putative mitochondrial protein [Cucumis melo var. makuwa]
MIEDRLTASEAEIEAIKQEVQRLSLLEKNLEKVHVMLSAIYEDRQRQLRGLEMTGISTGKRKFRNEDTTKEEVEEGETSLSMETGAGQDRIKFKKLEMLVFNGEDPDGWFYRAEHYFQMHLGRLVGKLNYLTVTRSDIAYFVSVVSQFISSPIVDHRAVVEHILCYLKAAPRLAILYKDHGHTRVECFSDVDWAGSQEDRRSTSGYCVFVGGNLVSWKSKKQNMVSRSSAESEYRIMTQSVCKIVLIHQLLSEIGFSIKVSAKLWCDNQVALHIASNIVFHERTKHIEVDCHFIREKIHDGLVSIRYLKTREQLGDILIKAVNGAKIRYLCNKLDMINIFASTQGRVS